jgi:hypothetical protein
MIQAVEEQKLTYFHFIEQLMSAVEGDGSFLSKFCDLVLCCGPFLLTLTAIC